MPRQLYSKRFDIQAGLAGTSPSITVPAGHVYVVKQITFYMNPSLGQARAFFEDDGSGVALFSDGTNIGTPLWAGFYGAMVFEEGEAFHFHTAVTPGDGVDCYVGGYDLITP